MSVRQKVLVVGAGVAGLTSALALRAKGFEVTVLDQDEPLPEGLTPQGSWDWRRRGAPQVRHPHFLMGRLRGLLHQRYPELIEDLSAAGIWELPFADTVHPAARAGYRSEPGDVDLVPLCARRTTFEMVLRRHIESRGIARIHSGARVDDLILEQHDGVVDVLGCRVAVNGALEELRADFVVDAAGRNSNFVGKLREAGATIDEDLHRSQTVYYTRHYRLREGAQFPPLTGLPAVDFADFTLGALPADNGTFTVTLAVWKDDPLLFEAGRDVGVFDRICASIPKIQPWVDPRRSEPLSGTFGFANMDYLWRRTVTDNRAQVLNLFLVGDCAIRTNPKFGRGCTWGSVAAHRLADVVAEVTNPQERAKRYEVALWQEFRGDWETLRQLEQKSRAKFEALIGKRESTTAMRLLTRLEDHIMNTAMAADSRVQRAIMRGYHGLDGMSAWMRSPRVWLGVLAAARPSRKLREVRYANAGRPSREEIAAFIGLAAR
jgi:2-polyprenyl-6-methoxyphenol hydroxylase-like FAD-dependent oxidoreductase